MNRNEEFMELKNELEQTPAELEYIAAKAIARAKKQKRISYLWKTPAVSFCSLIIMFILLVNLFPKVALAMSNVPFLKDLVSAVAFDPSLKAAVENDYYQVIRESQTQEDVTVNVDYMIVDAGHISLFFKVDAPVKEGLYRYDFLDGDGKPLPIVTSCDTMYETGKLEEIQLEFTDPEINIPEEFQFNIKVNKNPEFSTNQTITISPEDEYLEPADIPASYDINDSFAVGTNYDFTFLIHPDNTFANTVDAYPIHQWVEMNGQRIYLDWLGIYPSYARLFLNCDTDNSAVLQSLEVYFKDDRGNIYDEHNGISGTGTVNSLDIGSIYCESSYFSEADHLTLYIDGIQMIEKDKLYGEINYKEKTISNIPENVTIDRMELKSTDLYIDLKATSEKSGVTSQLISLEYYDIAGNKYNFNSMSSNSRMDTNVYTVHFKIPNYEDHKYKIQWYSPVVQKLKEPVEINIK